jgi:hypothetical protein
VLARKHRRLEAIRKLRIGADSVEGVLRSNCDDGKLQFIFQMFDDVQEPLLANRVPCQQMMDHLFEQAPYLRRTL